MVLKLSAIAAFALANVATANAATFVTTLGSPTAFNAPAGGTTVDFNGALPIGFTLTGTGYQLANGDLANTYAEPGFSDQSQYLAVLGGGAATLQSAIGFQSVSFFLGSIDSYNLIELLSTTGSVIGSFGGGLFTADANGDQTLPSTNRRITFTTSPGDAAIGGVRFLSGTNSLEVDNVVFAVPEAGTWAMMMLGFAMIAGASRYRRRKTNFAFA